MAEHKGWRVVKRGTSWEGWAWDPAARKYRTATRPQYNEAKQWAADEHARFRAKLDRLATLKTKTLAQDYVRELRRLGRSESHVGDVERALVGEEEKDGQPAAHSFAWACPDLGHANARSQAREWLAGQADVTPRTRNKYLTYLKALGNWAVLEDRLPRNPLDAITPEKEPDYLKGQFTLDELRVLANADRHCWGAEITLTRGQRIHPAEKALLRGEPDPFLTTFLVQLYAGARAPDEVAALEWAHIDWTGRMVRLFGKGRKERLVPLQRELADYLLPLKRDAGPVATIETRNYWREFAAFADRHGVALEGRSPHSMRHSYVGLMTACGVPSLLLQAYLGHVSNATTGGYAKLAARYASVAGGWERGEFRLRTA